MNTWIRRTLRVLISAALALAVLAGIAVAGLSTTTAEAQTSPAAHDVASIPQRLTSGGGPYVVAVAIGASGTVVSDALAPYEVFASSPKFLVYTVAATAQAAPTRGGPAIVPTYTFADTRTGRAPSPDVVVVPAVDRPDDAEEEALRTWVTDQADAGALVLGVCAGSRVLAATGMLDGRTATSHWSRLGALAEQRPQVHWVSGQRYVQDGRVTPRPGSPPASPGRCGSWPTSRAAPRPSGWAAPSGTRTGRSTARPASRRSRTRPVTGRSA
jgi:putative intracellular protease/amidase